MTYHCWSGNRMILEIFEMHEHARGGEYVLSAERLRNGNFENRPLLSVSEIPKVGRTKKLGRGGRILCDD